MDNRAFTFAAYNAQEVANNNFFLVRQVYPAGVKLETAPEQAWNRRPLAQLELDEDVRTIFSDRKHHLAVPPKIELVMHSSSFDLGPSDGPRHLSDAEAKELLATLKIGALTDEEAVQRLRKGQSLPLAPHGTRLRDSALFRMINRRGGPVPQGGVLQTERFWLREGEVKACSLRVECAPDMATAIHVEQWRVGTHGDRDRPVGALTFLFIADEQEAQAKKRFLEEQHVFEKMSAAEDRP